MKTFRLDSGILGGLGTSLIAHQDSCFQILEGNSNYMSDQPLHFGGIFEFWRALADQSKCSNI